MVKTTGTPVGGMGSAKISLWVVLLKDVNADSLQDPLKRSFLQVVWLWGKEGGLEL